MQTRRCDFKYRRDRIDAWYRKQVLSDSASKTPRNQSIDVLRGAVMIIMALDHARDFYADGFRIRPEDLATTTPFLFFTRWVTHFCAPVFVFLAGTAAFLSRQKRSGPELTKFLLTRGLWMIALELTIVRIAWSPNPHYRFTSLQILWAIGWSMVALAFLCRLPAWIVGAFGAVMILGHNALEFVHPEDFGSMAWLWKVLHEQGWLTLWPDHYVYVAYPLIPWIGVMAVGYAFGAISTKTQEVRRAITMKIGLVLSLAFVVLRASNLYGDPLPWSPQHSFGFTLMSFLKCEKFPPSLCFLLMTLGPALCALSLLDRAHDNRGLAVLRVFGSVPLFYYIMHLVIMRFTALPIAFYQQGPLTFSPAPEGSYGMALLPLWAAYLGWIAVVTLLYPMCTRFLKLKRNHKEWYWSYL